MVKNNYVYGLSFLNLLLFLFQSQYDNSFFFIHCVGWSKNYPDNPLFKPSSLLDKMVAQGKLGRKSGEGFYPYKK